jgi:hypothetical protein
MAVIGDPGEHIEYRGFVIVGAQRKRMGGFFQVNLGSNEPTFQRLLSPDDQVIEGATRDEAITAAKHRVDYILRGSPT